jgi:hypothetical protein
MEGNMQLFPTFIFALGLGLSSAGAGAVSLIANGGFETGTFTPVSHPNYDTITQAGPQDLTGWTVGNSLAWGVNAPDMNTHSGIGYVDLTGIGDTRPRGILSQTILTTAGNQYDFSIFESQDFVGPAAIDVFANGVPLLLSGIPGFWNYAPHAATYGELTSTFIANSASTTISIVGRALGFTQYMIGLDDVSVTARVSAVPVPGALPLFATAMGAMCALRRRKKSQ